MGPGLRPGPFLFCEGMSARAEARVGDVLRLRSFAHRCRMVSGRQWFGGFDKERAARVTFAPEVPFGARKIPPEADSWACEFCWRYPRRIACSRSDSVCGDSVGRVPRDTFPRSRGATDARCRPENLPGRNRR